MKLQFRKVQLSLNQTKIAKENKGLFLVGGLARLQRKQTQAQDENVTVEAPSLASHQQPPTLVAPPQVTEYLLISSRKVSNLFIALGLENYL